MVGDIKLMARAVTGIDIKDLKSLADEGKKQLGSGVVAIVGITEDGKAGIVVGVTADLYRASTRSISCARAPRRSAARAAAAGPTWRRPAARTAARPTPRSRRSRRRSAASSSWLEDLQVESSDSPGGSSRIVPDVMCGRRQFRWRHGNDARPRTRPDR